MASGIALVPATAVLTFTADPAADDTVTIGGVAYTFKAVPGAAYQVDVGATRAASINNLIAAINRSGTPGATTYHADTVKHPAVSAALSATDEVTVTARVAGSIGNCIVLASSNVGNTWAAAAPTDGSGDLAQHIANIFTYNQINSELLSELLKITPGAD